MNNTAALGKSFCRARNQIDQILEFALLKGATDIHLRGNSAPIMRVNGEIIPVSPEFAMITNESLLKFLNGYFSPTQKERFQQGQAIDLNYSHGTHHGSFRLNASKAQGHIIITTRPIKSEIPTFETLKLPDILKKIADFERGLVLVVGTTGSGKSSTLAALIDFINSNQKSHIVTIEDPIEYRFANKKGIVTQKEVGRDVPDFKSSLRAALRQDPDVIMVGEMRDQETVDTAIQAAETGHLVFATLHTVDARESINRILASYSSSQQMQIRYQLASILKAVVAQRLVPRKDGQGVIPAVEVMITNERIREMIEDPDRTHDIKAAIEEGHVHFNMQTFDQSLLELLTKGHITHDTALRNSSRPDEFVLRCEGIETIEGEKYRDFDFEPRVVPEIDKYPPPWKRSARYHSERDNYVRLRRETLAVESVLYLFSFSLLFLGFCLYRMGAGAGAGPAGVLLAATKHFLNK